jgi:hypothetical protein
MRVLKFIQENGVVIWREPAYEKFRDELAKHHREIKHLEFYGGEEKQEALRNALVFMLETLFEEDLL